MLIYKCPRNSSHQHQRETRGPEQADTSDADSGLNMLCHIRVIPHQWCNDITFNSTQSDVLQLGRLHMSSCHRHNSQDATTACHSLSSSSRSVIF